MPDKPKPLTVRQRQTLEQTARGNLGKNAAANLGISERMFQRHMNAARIRLGANTQAHAVALAVNAGLITPHAKEQGAL